MIVQELEIPLSQVTLQGLHGYDVFSVASQQLK